VTQSKPIKTRENGRWQNENELFDIFGGQVMAHARKLDGFIY
jgi:hypothetical protein